MSNSVKYTQNGGNIILTITEVACDKQDHAKYVCTVVDKRNSLNHFGYQGQESEEDVPTYLDLQSGLKEIYNAFVNIIAKTCTGRNADGEKVDISSWKE